VRGLKVPAGQPERSRLWQADGSCVRLRAECPNHVWAYHFVGDRTHDRRKFRMLCGIDELAREALAILVKRRLNSMDVLETLADLILMRGILAYVRSDNGPEFVVAEGSAFGKGVEAARALVAARNALQHGRAQDRFAAVARFARLAGLADEHVDVGVAQKLQRIEAHLVVGRLPLAK